MACCYALSISDSRRWLAREEALRRRRHSKKTRLPSPFAAAPLSHPLLAIPRKRNRRNRRPPLGYQANSSLETKTTLSPPNLTGLVFFNRKRITRKEGRVSQFEQSSERITSRFRFECCVFTDSPQNSPVSVPTSIVHCIIVQQTRETPRHSVDF